MAGNGALLRNSKLLKTVKINIITAEASSYLWLPN